MDPRERRAVLGRFLVAMDDLFVGAAAVAGDESTAAALGEFARLTRSVDAGACLTETLGMAYTESTSMPGMHFAHRVFRASGEKTRCEAETNTSPASRTAVPSTSMVSASTT
jgi:hypothetical protein